MYADQWSKNAELNLDSGIYEWAEEFINPYHKVLEIGCGVGHSTITLLRRDHKVYAVDMNQACIDRCMNLIHSEDYSARITSLQERIVFSDEDATLLCANFADETVRLLKHLDPNVVILWNPGGWNTSRCSLQQGYDENWRLVEIVIEYAKAKNIPLMIMNRFASPKYADDYWEDVSNEGMKKLSQDIRYEHQDVKDGIALIDEGRKVTDIYYAIALFVPEEAN